MDVTMLIAVFACLCVREKKPGEILRKLEKKEKFQMTKHPGGTHYSTVLTLPT